MATPTVTRAPLPILRGATIARTTQIEKLERLSAHLGGKVELYAKREQFHSNIIGQAVDLGREEVRQRIAQTTDYFLAHGVADPTAAQHQAIIALGNTVKRQALVLGFSDTFAVIGVVLILAAIAIFLTRKVKAAAAGGAH